MDKLIKNESYQRNINGMLKIEKQISLNLVKNVFTQPLYHGKDVKQCQYL